jgi:transcriptional regulator with XRE-family HTH domain
MTQDPDARQEGGGVERADLRGLRGLRGGGLKLPGLKLWRVRSGLTQRELAERVGVPLHYVQRAEQGRRGCNPEVARKMADALGVDLQELRAAPDEGEIAAVEEARVDSGGKPPQPHLGSPRYLHQAYLKVILNREVGSAYSVLDEREFESHIRSLPVEEVMEIFSRRRRELEFVKEELASEAELHPQVHLFLEELVRERPAQDIRVLAMRRAWEPSEEGHERLTQAMRELV